VTSVLSRASSADCDVIAVIHNAAFGVAEAWSRDVFSLQLALPNVFGLLDPAGGMILVRIAADEAEILTLAVAPAVQRGGIARGLLGQATTLAEKMGVRSVFLEVSVTNIAAQQLYLRSGFTEVGRRPHYYSDRTDALVLRRDISPQD